MSNVAASLNAANAAITPARRSPSRGISSSAAASPTYFSQDLDELMWTPLIVSSHEIRAHADCAGAVRLRGRCPGPELVAETQCRDRRRVLGGRQPGPH